MAPRESLILSRYIVSCRIYTANELGNRHAFSGTSAGQLVLQTSALFAGRVVGEAAFLRHGTGEPGLLHSWIQPGQQWCPPRSGWTIGCSSLLSCLTAFSRSGQSGIPLQHFDLCISHLSHFPLNSPE